MHRRFGPFGTFPALLALALAVLALAAAPALAGRAEARPHDMADAMPMARAPCADKAGADDHALGKHAGNCLATCLAGHGAVLPVMPVAETLWLGAVTQTSTFRARELRACASGLDPPPPRTC